MNQASERKLDPEAVCTRIISRLIEEHACLDIAPDSPAWRDLLKDGARIGELRVYRGRGRVQKVVNSHVRLADPLVDWHSVAVFSDPSSPLPHFVLSSVHTGSRINFYVDFLPKRDLGVAISYLDLCFAPLSKIRTELDQDARFKPGTAPLRQRALLSPWMALYGLEPDHLDVAMGYIERYFAHWAGLLKSSASELAAAPDVAARDRVHRKLVFNRENDPVWALLDQTVGRDTVDMLLGALAD